MNLLSSVDTFLLSTDPVNVISVKLEPWWGKLHWKCRRQSSTGLNVKLSLKCSSSFLAWFSQCVCHVWLEVASSENGDGKAAGEGRGFPQVCRWSHNFEKLRIVTCTVGHYVCRSLRKVEGGRLAAGATNSRKKLQIQACFFPNSCFRNSVFKDFWISMFSNREWGSHVHNW